VSPSTRGFTLMEVLVVLIVSALATTLMFQALAGFNRSRLRAAELEGVRNNQAVLAGWIGDSIRGIVAIDPVSLPQSTQGDAALGLTGTSTGFAALTLSPLLGSTGVPVEIHWRIEHANGGDDLIYEEAGQQPLRFSTDGPLKFNYRDEAGAMQEQWPTRLGVQQALPRIIELAYVSDGQQRVQITAIAASRAMQLPPYGAEAEP
jgi:general secretion pathway protein J